MVTINMNMTPTVILWIYIVLLVVGGLIGMVKAGSKVSLFISLGFAVLLSLCAMRIIHTRYAAEVILLTLLLVFGVRFAKTKKFMPMGLLTVATIVTLALRQLMQ
jgi:uncharacterized membrane protein (UPF0136 family)